MKARDIVGRKIVAVRQIRFWNERLKCMDVQLQSIALDNGKTIVFESVEDEYDHFVSGEVIVKGKANVD